jgi:putative acetyltransferase
MIVRKSNDSDIIAIMKVNKEAFKSDIEEKLVLVAFSDPTAMPVLSLVAEKDEELIGHILFTKCALKLHKDVSVYILVPMSVLPDYQGEGVGGALIKHGLEVLASWGVDFVVLLGHSGYYPRFGFKPAMTRFSPPYPVAEEHVDAWMVYDLIPERVEDIKGQVVCADFINKPEYW